jgi:hypothetical protein
MFVWHNAKGALGLESKRIAFEDQRAFLSGTFMADVKVRTYCHFHPGARPLNRAEVLSIKADGLRDFMYC